MDGNFLPRLLDLVFQTVPCDRAAFAGLDERGELAVRRTFLRSGGAAGSGNGGTGACVSGGADGLETLLRRGLGGGTPLLADAVLPAGSDRGPAASIRPPGRAGRVLCLPLVAGGRPVAVFGAIRERPAPPFTWEDLEFLAALLSPARLYLARRRRAAVPQPAAAEAAGGNPGGAFFLSRNPAFLKARDLIDRVKDTAVPVFISGESGTGKELAARTLHATGARRGGPFVALNCAAVPEPLLESELFGHVRGAFTGAVRDKPGLLAEADGGTFFLDEIGDLPPALQVKLLRVLEDRTVRRVGSTSSRTVDVRFVSATHRDIEREVGRGAFREDLYYRLKIIAIELPPLRDRPEDIEPLLRHFAAHHARLLNRLEPVFSAGALERLAAHSWPGNVRELQNEIQRCLVLAGDASVIREEHLSPGLRSAGPPPPSPPRTLREARAEFERRFLGDALDRCGRRPTRTAAEVGLTRQGLFKLMRKHGLRT